MAKNKSTYDVTISETLHIHEGEEDSAREAARRYVDYLLGSPVWRVDVEGPDGRRSRFMIDRASGETTFVCGD